MFCQIVLSGLLLIANASANPLLAMLDRRATSCAADNCARAVTGISTAVKPSLSVRQSDCSSFFSVTVTPVTTSTTTIYSATVTSVVTSVVTSTSTTLTTTTATPANAQKRQNTVTAITKSPTNVPAYASACSGSSRYSSACSCLGITRATSTAAISTSLVTVTAVSTTITTTHSTTIMISTSTSTILATPSCNAFRIKVTDGPFAGRYFSGSNDLVRIVSTDPAEATVFEFRGSKVAQVGQVYQLETVTHGEGYLYLDDIDSYNAAGNDDYMALSCVVDADKKLVCHNDQPGYFNPGGDSGLINFGPDPAAANVFVPRVVLAC